MQTVASNFPIQPAQTAAFDNLQSAILRLADRPSARPGTSERQELNARVERALTAYREYMKAMKQ